MDVSIKRDAGMLKISIDGKLYSPLSFKSFRPNPTNVSEFYNAGIRLFSVLSSGIINALGVPYSHYGESWIGDNEYDFSAIDRQMDMFIANAPDAYFAPMFQLDTRPWYLKSHPGLPNSFTHLSQVAHDEEWRHAAAEYLKAAVRHCEEKYGDKIYGYFILGGMTTEWFSLHDKEAPHPIKEAAYRKYLNDEAAHLPTTEENERRGNVFLSESEENVRTARRFHCETVTDLVLYFASEAQSVIKHKKLLGCYYGYLMHLGGEFLFYSGHLGYEKLFLSPDIDMISSPSDYHYRGIDDPSAFMVTKRTLDLHNKLYFLEFDHITHVAPSRVSEPCDDPNGNAHILEIPGADSKCKDEAESLNLMYRDYVLCYGNGAALWWFDMFDGWFRSERMMASIRRMVSLHDELSSRSKESVAEVAVFAEGESMYNVRRSSGLGDESLIKMQRTLAEMGAPYDLYSISDIDDKIIANYKLLIILNSYDISEQKLETLRNLQNNGAVVLWLYAPGYAHHGKCSIDNISKVVGMNIEVSDDSLGAYLYSGTSVSSSLAAPYFSVNDPTSRSIALFEDAAVAIATSSDAKNIYAAVPYINSDVVADILDKLGIFRYSRDKRLYTYVNRGAIGTYNATGSDASLYVRDDGKYVDVLFGDEFYAKNGVINLPLREINAFLLIKE